MRTTLARKAWRDLGRRRARAILTGATIALSVAGVGLLAVPSIIDRTMTAEVRESRLYDVTLAVRDIPFDDADAQDLYALGNIDAVSARVTYATRVLIGDRRIPVSMVGIDNFASQQIDVVRATEGGAPRAGQVLADEGDRDAVDVTLRVGDTVDLIASDGSTESLDVVGRGRSLAFWQGPWSHPKQLILYATSDTVRPIAGLSGVNTLAFRLRDTHPEALAATVAQLRLWLDNNAGPGALIDLPVTRDEGDWPGRVFTHQMTTFVYVLAGLALVTAMFLIANTMNTLMAEQTAEIGIMKAIGGRRRQIGGTFLRSALYLALFGVLFGVPLGAAMASAIAGYLTSSVLGVPGRFAVSAAVIAFSAAFATLMTLGATVPALRRALRVPVRQALQTQSAPVAFGTSSIDRLLLHGQVLPRPVRFGTRNLVRNKRRTVATTVQIALAVATALGFLNMATSFRRALDHDFATIQWDAAMYAPPGAPQLDARAREAATATPGIERVEPVLQNTLDYKSESYPVFGMTASALYLPELRSGRWFSEAEARQGEAVAVVGPNAARENHLAPGDTVTVQTAGGDRQLRIIAVDANQRNDGRSFYVPLLWLQGAGGWQDSTNLLWLTMTHSNTGDIDRITNTVEDSLTAAGYRVAPEKLHDLKAESQRANDAILNMINIVGGVVVLIGMVGLVNAITMNVIERTREIGVLRCVGARARDIRRSFAAESAGQAILGWILGLPLGLALSWGLARLTLIVMELEIATVFDLRTALAVLIATIAVAVLIIIGPVRRVTHINPGDALRYV